MRVIDVQGVAARSTLADLRMGRFQPVRKHKAETVEENKRHNVRDIAKVSIKLIDNATLNSIINLQAAARNEHNRLTVPTCERGMRLLPGKRMLEHSEIMQKFADEHESLVQQFIIEYPNEAAQAPVRLNGLYDASMWPNVAEVPGKFKFRTRYLPTPTNGQWGEWLADSIEAAEAEIQDRLRKVLTHVSERCKKLDGRLHASVFEAVKELADLIPDLDFNGTFQPFVDAIQPLANADVELARDNDAYRQACGTKADSIVTLLGGIS